MATTVGSSVYRCLGVHERGPWAQKLRPQQRGRRPSTVTSRSARSAGLLPYHQRGKLGGLRRCPCFVDSFITKVGLQLRRHSAQRRGHSAATAEAMCAPQSLLYSEGTLAWAGTPCGGFCVDFPSGKTSLERRQRSRGSTGLSCLLRPPRGDSAPRASQACRPGP